MVWSSQWQQDDWPPQRHRLGHCRAVGVLVDWQHKADKSFGWIVPIYGVPTHIAEAQFHGGDAYVHWRDIQDPRPGAIVTFWPYIDQRGLGAEECVSRPVLRFAVLRDSKSALTLPLQEVNPCATYLTSSIFYPELEEQGVTLRKYLWEGLFTVFELWGAAEDVVTAAEELGLLVHPDAQVLVSPAMASTQPLDAVREFSAEELPHVPPRFRLAVSLARDGQGNAEEARRRLLALLGTANA